MAHDRPKVNLGVAKPLTPTDSPELGDVAQGDRVPALRKALERVRAGYRAHTPAGPRQ